WCHNPESISPDPQVHWVKTRCIGCRTCLETCEHGALDFTHDGLHINRERCTGCLSCTKTCPSTALESFGHAWALDELVSEVLKDRVYFETSLGGITISGGEPAMQGPFAAAFLKALKEKGIHTALDTCGQCTQKTLALLVEHADLVLFDLKEIDPQRHKRFTGATNDRILKNLAFIAREMKSGDCPGELWVRTPLIPGYTATEENIAGIGRFIADNLSGIITRWELCSFNNLCTHKYEELGLTWACRDFKLMSEQELGYFTDIARRSCSDPSIVQASGPTRIPAGKDEDSLPAELADGGVRT
ncbi:MAG: glycyl-radical enzyme activating protein, partial [Deltaproteobacteria bacterium]|nr:glycyl-radical enzyme activating protein [Deltaproteobacteria bacterium]